MKRIPLRIFIIVLITGIIGVTGMVVLKYNIDKLSNTYHVIMDEHAANQDYMKSIMTHLYQHKAHVMDHILANSEDMYDKYEQKEVELRNKMIDEFTEFGSHMQGNERKRYYHKVYSNYYSYLRNVDIVLELSRDGSKNMATYYVNTTMVGFLENVDHDLSELDELTVNEMNAAKAYMDRLIRFSQVSESICIIFILVAVIVCLVYCVNLTTKLENARREADAANRSKSLFLAKMSHEIRTPINAIIGMNEMILREEDRQDIIDYGMDVKRSAYSLLSTINDILDLSKIESGKMELVFAEYDVCTLLYDIVNMISMKAKDKGLEIKLSLDEQLPSKLYGDDVRLRQILINLLNNAVKYTDTGSVTLSVSGEIQDSNVNLYFEVKDTGIGIKKEDLNKLFAEFERIEEKRNRNIEGTGLGISITTQLLTMMGSQLKVDSVYGEGSKFYFHLLQNIVDKEPIGDIEERVRQQVVEYNYEVSFVAPEAKILVVDDNQLNRKVFFNLLRELQMEIHEAAGGFACLDMVTKQPYDLIFLDHMMPDLDGVETIKKMRALDNNLCKETPVIALTANALSGVREMYLDIGFSDYLSKPFQPEKLEEMLLEYLPKEKVVAVDTSDLPKKRDKILNFADQGFPDVEGMDWKYAAIVQPNAEFLLDMILMFTSLLKSEAQVLKQNYNILLEMLDTNPSESEEVLEAWRQYRVKVHAMKTSAAMIGAVSLSSFARLLEDFSKKLIIEPIKALTDIFLEEWLSYEERLSVFKVNEGNMENEKKFSASAILKLLSSIDAAMEDMDVDTADEIIKQIQCYEIPDNLNQLVNQLASAVINLDIQMEHEIVKKLSEEMKTT
ncbi:MAG: response regulator [Lachnospiraceae bacterium]|nr:response regulator [Lachnospiraceae bacterium]